MLFGIIILISYFLKIFIVKFLMSIFDDVKNMVEQEKITVDPIRDEAFGLEIIKTYNKNIPNLVGKLRKLGTQGNVIKALNTYLFGSGKKNSNNVVTPSKSTVATIKNNTTNEKVNIQGYKVQELDSLKARLNSIGKFLNGNLEDANGSVKEAHEILVKSLGNLDMFKLPTNLEARVPDLIKYIDYARNNLTEKAIKENQQKHKEVSQKAAEEVMSKVFDKSVHAVDDQIKGIVQQELKDAYDKGHAAGDIAGQIKGFSKGKAKYERRRASDSDAKDVPMPPPEHEPDASKKEIAKPEDVKVPEKKAQMTLNEYIEGIIQNDAFEVPEEKLREGIENAIKNKIVDIPKEQIETVIDKIYLDSLVYNQKLNEAATKLGFSRLPKAIQQRLKRLQRTDIENRKYKLFKKMVPKEPSDENVRKISEFEDFYKHLNPLLLRGVVRLGRY